MTTIDHRLITRPWAEDDPTDDAVRCVLGTFAALRGQLTVSDLLALRPKQADLVFLSACQTGRTSLISDEPVSLASALMIAGYRDAVGTLWRVTDRAAAMVAAEFYAALERHGYGADRVAHALNEAITTLRRRHPDRPYDWLAYIHLGP